MAPGALPPASATPAETREFVLHVLCMEDYGLLPIYREEIVRIYNEWNRGGNFLRNASERELASISVAMLLVRMEVEKLQTSQSSQVGWFSEEGARKLTYSKLRSAFVYTASWLSAVTGLIGAELCPPDLVSNDAIPANCLVPLNALAKLALIGGPLGVIWIAAYYRDRLWHGIGRMTAANSR